jgi:phosphoglycolate phosphatase-like HAD superfamily hydrolase
MSKPDYTALGLAALAGAVGALGAQYLCQMVASWNDGATVSSKRRRGSMVPDQFAKRSIRSICWDMDGTLIKTELIWFSLLKDALVNFGFEASHFTYDLWSPHFGQSMQENVNCWFPGLEVEKLDEFCTANYESKLGLLEVIDHAPEMLTFSNQVTDNSTFIVTNCPRDIVNMVLSSPKCQFLKDNLSNPDGTLRILCPGDLDQDGNPLKPKPTTSMLMHAAKVLRISTHEVILIGDSIFDVEAISSAGGVAIELSLTHEHKQSPSGFTPFLKISSLQELFQIQQLFDFPAVSPQ